MKKILKIVLAVIVQLVLLSTFDCFFIIHSIGVSSAYSWWFFVAYNLVAISAIVMSIVLRHLDDVKILPSTVLMITVLIAFLFSTVTIIIDYQNLKYSIIASLSMVIISVIVETTMYAIQHYRRKHMEKEIDLQGQEVRESEEDDVAVTIKAKIKSSALLLLTMYITDLKKWENLDSMPFVDELTQVITSCRQYTYEELSNIEEELKVQTKALKTYTINNSVQRATSTANRIITLLHQREEELDKIENQS